MIGPSSGPSGATGREVVENPVRIKRKVFDDLDIESLCEEVCHSGKKRFLTELPAPLDPSTTQTLVDPSEFSPSTVQGEAAPGVGSVARLEVLVVDGTWDPSTLGQAEFTDASSSIGNPAGMQTLSDAQSVENGYGAILSYWEATSAPETTQNGTDGVEVPVTPATPSPSMPSPPAEDQENGNLSWLLDFKLDSFIEAPEDAGRSTFPTPRDGQIGHRNRFNAGAPRSNVLTPYANDARRSCGNQNESVTSSNVSSMHQDIRQPAAGAGTYAVSDNRSFAASRYAGPKKPPFTYTELIEHALRERGELTVSAIYQWISEHFPYYKSNDDRWKNSVRHNLSINPHFRKGSKAPHGAGHLWAIANRGETRPRQLTTSGTTLPTPRQLIKSLSESTNVRKQSNVSSKLVTMDEVAAATASISQPEENNAIASSVTLEHCAEEILSGIKREVEVQYLVPMVVPVNDTEQDHGQIQQAEQTEQQCPVKESDFLNPVSKEVVAEECGLIGESYLVTDLNPAALGLNMAEPEIITSDNLFGEELSFQFYEFTSPSQLQSA